MLTQYSKDMERMMTALNLCRVIHQNQTDKCGQPYWIHPFTVAMRGFSGYSKHAISNVIVGLLHDIPEDTDLSVDAIDSIVGLTYDEKAALKLLTREDGMSYNQYIKSIIESGNRIAIEVKLDDLCHNMDLGRFADAGVEITEEDLNRREKYSKTFAKLLYKLNEIDDRLL